MFCFLVFSYSCFVFVGGGGGGGGISIHEKDWGLRQNTDVHWFTTYCFSISLNFEQCRDVF